MKFTFIGCSQTKGEGLELLDLSPYNYANIIGKNYDASVKNLAEPGLDNNSMFILGLEEIYNDTPDILFVQWSSLDRFKLFPGPDTQFSLMPIITKDYSYRKIFIAKKQLQQLADYFFVLNHHYHALLSVINYCNILENTAQGKCKIVFINGCLPWKDDLAISQFDNYNKQLSNYTKDLLDFDYRQDDEIELFLNRLTKAFASLNRDLWPNLFNNFESWELDSWNDHPGIKTNKFIADQIITYLDKKLK